MPAHTQLAASERRRALFLDDCPERTAIFRSLVPDAVCVETADACIEQLSACPWDVAFLDHDLGGEVYVDSSKPNTGAAVVRWIVEHRPDVGSFVVHSLNADAAKRMVAGLREAGYGAEHVPFAWRRAELLGMFHAKRAEGEQPMRAKSRRQRARQPEPLPAAATMTRDRQRQLEGLILNAVRTFEQVTQCKVASVRLRRAVRFGKLVEEVVAVDAEIGA